MARAQGIFPPEDAVRVGDYVEERLGPARVALVSRFSRRWAVVSTEAADLLRHLGAGTVIPVGGDQAPELQAFLTHLTEAGIFHPVTPRLPPTNPQASPRPSPTLLIKMTGACNIACGYCYDFHKERWHGKLDLALVRRTIEDMVASDPRLDVLFHGGEPLLAFAQIREIVAHCDAMKEAHGAQITYSLQTNGLLITAEIVEFLLEHGFDVGISLDGPEAVNDSNRKDHRGNGTYRRLIGVIESFPDFFQRRVGYLAVVDTDSEERLNEILTFFTGLGAPTLKLMPVHGGGRSSNDGKTDFEPFLAFLSAQLERIGAGEGSRPYLLNLIELIDRFLRPREENICMAKSCGAGREFLVIDAENNVRACDILYHDEFLLLPSGHGMASGRPAEEARASANAQRLRSRESWLHKESDCGQCTWLAFCGGSCPGKALMSGGSIMGVDEIECQTRIRLFPRILDLLAQPDSPLLSHYEARYRDRERALTSMTG